MPGLASKSLVIPASKLALAAIAASTTVGPRGAMTTFDRTRNADGTVDATITKTKP